ncbi:MAG: hypothetical protein ACFBSG_21005 [Leptolyngbyaceae cyanobacterium]
MFDIEEFIIAVFITVEVHLDTLLRRYPPRHKGFAPGLSDSEVLTLEIVGEFLGHHRDTAIWRYFRRHWHAWFPGLGRLYRILCKRSKIPITQETASCPGRNEN